MSFTKAALKRKIADDIALHCELNAHQSPANPLQYLIILKEIAANSRRWVLVNVLLSANDLGRPDLRCLVYAADGASVPAFKLLDEWQINGYV